MGYQSYIENVIRAQPWAHWDYTKCECTGGWWSSEFDSYHECSCHPGGDHPEMDDYADEMTDQELALARAKRAEWTRQQYRTTYQGYYERCRKIVAWLTMRDFNRLVAQYYELHDLQPPQNAVERYNEHYRMHGLTVAARKVYKDFVPGMFRKALGIEVHWEVEETPDNVWELIEDWFQHDDQTALSVAVDCLLQAFGDDPSVIAYHVTKIYRAVAEWREMEDRWFDEYFVRLILGCRLQGINLLEVLI